MLFNQATATQIQIARVLGGVTIVGFLAARMFGHRGQRVRVAVAGLYFAGILGFVVYALS